MHFNRMQSVGEGGRYFTGKKKKARLIAGSDALCALLLCRETESLRKLNT